jgi:hypothetical protein
MNILVITLGKSDIQVRNKPGTGFTIDDNGKNRIVLKKTGLPEVMLKQNRGYPEYLLASPRTGKTYQ